MHPLIDKGCIVGSVWVFDSYNLEHSPEPACSEVSRSSWTINSFIPIPPIVVPNAEAQRNQPNHLRQIDSVTSTAYTCLTEDEASLGRSNTAAQ